MSCKIKKLHQDISTCFYQLLNTEVCRDSLADIKNTGEFSVLDDDELGVLSQLVSGESANYTFKIAVHALSFLASQNNLARRQINAYKQVVFELLDSNRDIIIRRCSSYQLSADAVDDFCQDFYIKLLRSLPKFEPSKSSFRTWVSFMVNNYLIDRHRRKSLMNVEGDINFESIEGTAGVSVFTHEDIDRFCNRALRVLDEDERIVVEGRYGFDDSDVKTYEELSDLTGIPSSSIRQKTAPAALDKLKKFSSSAVFGVFSC